jgi:exopolysaccharide biosynthesis polyprenyl glycosylphosphotransferase
VAERCLAVGVLAVGIVLALSIVVGGTRPLAAHALLASLLAGGIWTAVLRVAFSATAPVLGSAVAAAAGTLVGLVCVSAAQPWLAALAGTQLSPRELGEMTLAVFVVSMLWVAVIGNSTIRRRRIMIVGTTECVADVATELGREHSPPFTLVGSITPTHDIEPGTQCLGNISVLRDVVEAQRPDIVVFADEACCTSIDQLIDATGEAGPRICGLVGFFEHAFGRVPLRHLTATWFISLLHLRQRPVSRATKRLFDVSGALFGLLLTAPLLALIAVLVRQTPGPVIIRQTRLGRAGKPFRLYKFRTMRADAEADGHSVWAQEHDPRVTRVGRTLRTTHLDELPQLWNVLRGDMSLVGPRPERPELIGMLEQTIPFWGRRLMIKPGLTGWAQIHSGYADDVGSGALKLSYDLWYLRHRTLALDVAICAKTVAGLLFSARGR